MDSTRAEVELHWWHDPRQLSAMGDEEPLVYRLKRHKCKEVRKWWQKNLERKCETARFTRQLAHQISAVFYRGTIGPSMSLMLPQRHSFFASCCNESLSGYLCSSAPRRSAIAS
ncbi:unnamed protein product [Amoebophrya sp. A25]|nr:unnamed protein product [Amoebophrya sp. A25]|eukprot:GSA25T00006249001.1